MTGLDLDTAAALRMLRWDAAKERANKKFWTLIVLGEEASEKLFPGEEDVDEGVLESDINVPQDGHIR